MQERVDMVARLQEKGRVESYVLTRAVTDQERSNLMFGCSIVRFIDEGDAAYRTPTKDIEWY